MKKFWNNLAVSIGILLIFAGIIACWLFMLHKAGWNTGIDKDFHTVDKVFPGKIWSCNNRVLYSLIQKTYGPLMAGRSITDFVFKKDKPL